MNYIMEQLSRIPALIAGELSEWWLDGIKAFPAIIAAGIVLIIFYIIARFARRGVRRITDRWVQGATAGRLLTGTAYFAIIMAGVFAALGILKLDKTITSLLAGAGILGLAVGLAFKDIASNYIAGIMLAIQQPFVPGEIVEVHDYFGEVAELTLRYTAIRTPNEQLVLVPNNKVINESLTNYSRTGLRRVEIPVGVSYNDGLGKVQEVTERALRGLTLRAPDTDVEVVFEKFGGSSVDFLARFWIQYPEPTEFFRARSQGIIAIKKAFDSEGITIPFPIRTIDFGIKGGLSLKEIADQRAHVMRDAS